MPLRNRTRLLLIIASMVLPGIAWAESLPHTTVDAMCDQAEVIIEGIDLGDDVVRISEIHKSSKSLKEGAETVVVSQLSQHSRTVGDGYFDTTTALKTRKLVLFLVRNERSGHWESIETISRDGQCGSCGLFWFDDSNCHGYQQVLNPGPYVLLPGEVTKDRIPKTIDALRREIETGLANSREWQRSLAIADHTERAKTLARYLLKSTAPQRDKGTFLQAVRKEMAALKQDAVPVIVQLLHSAPADEKLDTAVLILYDIGPPAAEAIPSLVPLLAAPDRVFTGYVLSALGSTGDPRAVPHLEEYLNSKNERLTHDAKEALALHRIRQSR